MSTRVIAVLVLLAASGPTGSAVPWGRVPAVGLIEGVVRLSGGAAVEPRVVNNTTDPEECGTRQSLEDLLVAEPSRAIRNVIVALGGPAAESLAESAPERLVLENRDCRFSPHVAVLPVESTIEAVSHDETLHTVHLYGAVERNVALPRAGSSAALVIERPGMITVLCDVHGWMRAFIRVDRHRYHAVTGIEGRFRIADVPAGSYDLEIWHELLGARTRTVTVRAGETTDVAIVYPLPRDEPDR